LAVPAASPEPTTAEETSQLTEDDNGGALTVGAVLTGGEAQKVTKKRSGTKKGQKKSAKKAKSTPLQKKKQ